MARLPDGSDQSLVAVKAVDAAYPLYGGFRTTPSLGHEALFAEEDGVYGAAAAPLLMQRLSLKLGDTVLLGHARDRDPRRHRRQNRTSPPRASASRRA